MSVEHKIEVYNSNDDLVAELDKATGRKYGKMLNRGSAFSFELDINDPKCTADILAGGQNYIKYYRGTRLEWSGRILYRAAKLSDGGEKIDIQCFDWFTLFKKKLITTEESYSSTNEGAILQDLVTYFQTPSNGSLGITFGVNSSTSTRDKEYIDKSVYDAFIEMSEILDGVDFEITPNRVLNIYDKKSTDRSATHIFEYGVNLKSLDEVYDWTDLKNDLKGYGADTLVRTADDGSSQSTYGRMQSIESFTDDILTATLDRHLDDVLRTNAGPVVAYKCVLLPDALPEFGTYEIGDVVKLKANKGIVNVNKSVRIYGWNVAISDSGEEEIELIISPVQ